MVNHKLTVDYNEVSFCIAPGSGVNTKPTINSVTKLIIDAIKNSNQVWTVGKVRVWISKF